MGCHSWVAERSVLGGVGALKRGRVCLAVALGAALVSATTSVGVAAGLPREVNGKHVMWAAGQGYPAASDQTSANNLIYHGGLVEKPACHSVPQ